MMFRFILVMLVAAFTGGCEKAYEEPQAYVDAVLGNFLAFTDGPLEYHLSSLPLDYFVARELLAHPGGGQGIGGLRKSLKKDYGGGSFFMLRIGLDSAQSASDLSRFQLGQKMHALQIGQEAGRMDIIAHLKDGSVLHPDLYLAQSDWVGQSGFSILFCIKAPKASDIASLEFAKNIVFTRNQEIPIRDFRPSARLKG